MELMELAELRVEAISGHQLVCLPQGLSEAPSQVAIFVLWPFWWHLLVP